MIIQIKKLSYSFKRRNVLNDITITFRQGEMVSILGCNGTGKTTLLKCILGLLCDYTGQILVNDTEIKDISRRELASCIAYVPQTLYQSFSYSVFDMVLMGTTHRASMLANPGIDERQIANNALQQVEIAHLAKRSYCQISGGEQRLVLIARAFAQGSKVIVMDEPTANLDFANRTKVLVAARRLASAGYTIIQTTHDPDGAFCFSDRMLALKNGCLIADGTPASVLCPETMSNIYNIEVEVHSHASGKARFCIPKNLQ